MSPTYKPKYEGLKTIDIICIMVGKDVTLCPYCGEGKLQIKRTFLPRSSPYEVIFIISLWFCRG